MLILASHFAELGIAPRDTLAFRRELFRDAPCARVATEHGKGRRARAERDRGAFCRRAVVAENGLDKRMKHALEIADSAANNDLVIAKATARSYVSVGVRDLARLCILCLLYTSDAADEL